MSIHNFLKRYRYRYTDDELVLDEWFQTRYPQWWVPTTPKDGLFIREQTGDESNMTLGVFVDPAPVGDEARRFAHEKVDWSAIPRTNVTTQNVPEVGNRFGNRTR